MRHKRKKSKKKKIYNIKIYLKRNKEILIKDFL